MSGLLEAFTDPTGSGGLIPASGDLLGGIDSFSDLDLLDLSGTRAGERALEAGELQAQAAAASLVEGTRQFDITEARLQEAEQFRRGQIQPFQEAGVAALTEQQALLGLSGSEAEQAATQRIEESSGQQFLRRRQERALVRNASAIGGLGGGNVRTALQEQAVGFAQQDIQNQFGRLGQLAGQGQVAGTQLGQGAAGSAFDIGQFGAQSTSEAARLAQAASEARASGILGQSQAQAQGTQNALQLGGAALAFFSDEILKTDIVKIDQDDLGGIYTFGYKGSHTRYMGRLAHELQETRPDAVSMHESGYLQVTEEFRPEALTWH